VQTRAGLDILEYIKELRLWGYKDEADRKLYWVAIYADKPTELQKLFEEWKAKDDNYEYMSYANYRSYLY
jgi:hypothetical protein